MRDFQSEKYIPDQHLGISYTYFLDIVENNIISDSNEGVESYVYTARLNEVLLTGMPMVFIKYETNPMTVLYISTSHEWH